MPRVIFVRLCVLIGWGRVPALRGFSSLVLVVCVSPGGGGRAPALQGAALPPAVQGSPPSHVRWYVFRRRRGTSPSPTGGCPWWVVGRGIASPLSAPLDSGLRRNDGCGGGYDEGGGRVW